MHKFFFLAAIFSPLAMAGSSTLVISQVYGGGGNSGAAYKNDFIEIYNVSASTISLAGYSVQYASTTGTSWQVTPLSGSLAAGHYYLVQEAAGAGGTTNLPAADATGSINMSATAGKVALVSSQTALTGACPSAGVLDLIGFGTGTNCSETAVTPTLSNTTAAIRGGGGCTDTDNNSTDFSTGTPNPRNTASTAFVCGTIPALTITTSTLAGATLNVIYSATVSATGGSGTRTWSATGLPPGLAINSTSGTIGGTPNTTSGSPFTASITVADSTGSANALIPITVNVPTSCPGAIQIGQIQGAGDTSPLTGQVVTTSGIVTALRSTGFFLQIVPPGDSNAATSDGVFVFTSTAPPGTALAGNLVCVSGTVSEFNGLTELGTVTVLPMASSQTLPAPVTLTVSDLNPNGPLDLLEKYEGMRVVVPSMTVTGPTDGTIDEKNATSTSNGNFYGVLSGVPRPFREPGIALTDTLPPGTPPNVPRWDTNPQIITVFGLGQTGATPINVTAGATVTNLVGVLGYFPSAYEIYPDPSPAPGVSGNVAFTAVPDKAASELTIASTNLERFYNTVPDPIGSGTVVLLTPTAFANRLNKASLGIRNVLKLPDVVGVEEAQDLPTLQALASKVNSDALAATGVSPNYTAYLAEGNDPSNINVGFLVKSTVTVVDVTQYGKSTPITNPTSGSVSLLNDRPSLVLRARAAQPGSTQTMPFTVIVNHLRSLDGIDDPTTGPFVRLKRQKQAEYLADLIQSRQAADPNEKIISIGDYNAYQFNDGYVDSVGTIKGTPAPADQVVLASNPLVSPTLAALVDQAPAAEQYSYTFSGSAQEIDQILLNPPAMAVLSRYAVGRLDADFPESYRNDPNRPERISDHDWPVVYLKLPANAAPSNTDVTAQVSITSTGLSYSRITKQYTGTVTITNIGATPLASPLQLVLANLTAGDTLANATGVSTNGPYVTALAGGSLAPGASVPVAIRINGPQATAPSYTGMVFSGTF